MVGRYRRVGGGGRFEQPRLPRRGLTREGEGGADSLRLESGWGVHACVRSLEGTAGKYKRATS